MFRDVWDTDSVYLQDCCGYCHINDAWKGHLLQNKTETLQNLRNSGSYALDSFFGNAYGQGF